MTRPATTVGIGSSLADAVQLMETEQIRRLLVVDEEGRLCGVVAQADVALSGRDRKTAELVRGVSEPKH
jgi:CBS domain-containing protein